MLSTSATQGSTRPTPTTGAVKKEEGDKDNIGMIVGAVAGCMVFLVITVIAVAILAWHCG